MREFLLSHPHQDPGTILSLILAILVIYFSCLYLVFKDEESLIGVFSRIIVVCFSLVMLIFSFPSTSLSWDSGDTKQVIVNLFAIGCIICFIAIATQHFWIPRYYNWCFKRINKSQKTT